MVDQTRKLKLKKLDALYIVHNTFDCLIVYFCVCFTFIRIVYDLFDETAARPNAYVIAFIFTGGLGYIMNLWAKRTFKNLKLEDVL